MIILNLLPPAIKQDYQSTIRIRHWLNALVVLTVLVLIGTATTGGIWVMMTRHAANVKAELQELQQHQATSNGKDITSTTSQLNTTIKTFSTTLDTPRSWSADVTTILTGLPSAIAISSLTLQPNGQFHLIGMADSRQSFVQLEEALKANAKLTNIVTTSTASKRVDVPFDFSGALVAAPTS